MTGLAVVLLCLSSVCMLQAEPSKSCLCNSKEEVDCLPSAALDEVKTVLTGVCDNRFGCVQRIDPSAIPTARFFCSSTDVDEATEYSILNGKLEALSHGCNESHCLPMLLPSIERCEWKMSAADHASMLNLKCLCNNGDRCVDGTCDFSQSTVLLPGQFPACRYWWEAEWKEPMIDCWLASRAQDRAMFFDQDTVHLICRDGDYCNDADQVHLMVRSDEHCPAFLHTTPTSTKAVHKFLGVDVFKLRNVFGAAVDDQATTKPSVTHRMRHHNLQKMKDDKKRSGSAGDERSREPTDEALRSIPSGGLQDAAIDESLNQPIVSTSAALVSVPNPTNASSPSFSLIDVETEIMSDMTNVASPLSSWLFLRYSSLIIYIYSGVVVLSGH